jgi:hypothetical protein
VSREIRCSPPKQIKAKRVAENPKTANFALQLSSLKSLGLGSFSLASQKTSTAASPTQLFRRKA